ncbi:hypothetical protein EDB80DRAFT_332943 [Ilyonectria destructans]|nr:hypothetical protein EDB80DRAFT_332943 [Ilyonectria destructans]
MRTISLRLACGRSGRVQTHILALGVTLMLDLTPWSWAIDSGVGGKSGSVSPSGAGPIQRSSTMIVITTSIGFYQRQSRSRCRPGSALHGIPLKPVSEMYPIRTSRDIKSSPKITKQAQGLRVSG